VKSDKRKMARRKATPIARLGIADFKCNACGKVVQRDLGWKAWTPSYCEGTGRKARLYRISVPSMQSPLRMSRRHTATPCK
jgi:hypothetical protein